MNLINKAGLFLKKTISRIINSISIIFTYIIGIGLTSILGKIVGKKFLNQQTIKSSWNNFDSKINLEKMF